MTTWTLGQNCHITLQHDSVNSGAAYGFILNTDRSPRSEGIQIKRQVLTEDISDTESAHVNYEWVHFDILLGDHLIAPDGSLRAENRAADYALLVQYLAQTSGLNLTTQMGTFIDYSAVGWTADERHQPDHSIVKVGLCNVGDYFPPADPIIVAQSVWDGELLWGVCVWQ